jgi:hypothetical protein
LIYLLDTNVLIDAHRDYYPIERVPEFWGWLVYLGAQGKVKIPLEMYEEIKQGNDQLASWAKQSEVGSALLLEEEVNEKNVSMVIDVGYAPDLTDEQVIALGRDPFIIAYALVDNANRCVVTTEVSKPSKTRQNRHLPDVCSQFGIRSCNTYIFIEEMDFSTNWKTKQNVSG